MRDSSMLHVRPDLLPALSRRRSSSYRRQTAVLPPTRGLTPQRTPGKMIITVFAGIAEFERDLIRERTGAGRVIAKANGMRFGRPRKLNTEHRALALRLLREGRPPGRSGQDLPRAWGHDLPAGGSRGRNHVLSAFSVPLRPKPQIRWSWLSLTVLSPSSSM
jgi:Resolvase, N terminal domain